MLSYVINNTSTAVRPDKKTIKTDVKIHVVWDNNGGTQDYYGYQTYTGQYALTDGIERAGGVDEVLITDGKNAMTILQIAT